MNNMRKIINLMEGAGNKKLVNTLTARLQAADPKKIWSIIEAIGWGTFTTDYDSIELALAKVYKKRKIESIGKKAEQLRTRLQKSIKAYEVKHDIENLFNESDDGTWDITAHIVGLGKADYDQAMKDPSKYANIEAVENFEYSFLPN